MNAAIVSLIARPGGHREPKAPTPGRVTTEHGIVVEEFPGQYRLTDEGQRVACGLLDAEVVQGLRCIRLVC